MPPSLSLSSHVHVYIYIYIYIYPYPSISIERERERRHGRREVIAAGGRGAEQRRSGLDLSCSDASVVLLWCMFTALLALPYWCFHAFGKI